MAVNIEDRVEQILYYGYGVDDMIHIWGSVCHTAALIVKIHDSVSRAWLCLGLLVT